MTSPDKVAAYSDEEIEAIRAAVAERDARIFKHVKSYSYDPYAFDAGNRRMLATLDALRAERDALLAERDAANRRVDDGVERLMFWRGLYVSPVEAIMSDAKRDPTIRLYDVEARLATNEKQIINEANAHLTHAGKGAT